MYYNFTGIAGGIRLEVTNIIDLFALCQIAPRRASCFTEKFKLDRSEQSPWSSCYQNSIDYELLLKFHTKSANLFPSAKQCLRH